MKLALVTETYPPEVNGVAMTLSRLVEGMSARGHTVEVVRPRQCSGDEGSNDTDAHIQQVALPGLPIPRYEGLHFGLPARWKLQERWEEDRPDVVHIATEGPLGITALGAAEQLGIPVTSTFHTNFHQYSKHYASGLIEGPVMWYLRWVHNRCGVTMTPAQDVVDALTESGFERVTVLARGVDGELFHPDKRCPELREQWGCDDDTPVVAYVGRIAAEKNLPVAVEAVEAMKRINPRTRFLLVGDGPYRATLEEEHPEYIYAGMQRGEDLARHYASADAFVFASTTETFGNVVTEAMASGLVPLAYHYAAPKKVIRSGENGITVPFDDEPAFIKAAEQLIRDFDRWKQMGQAARKTVEPITWDAVVDRFEALLNEVKEHGKAAV